VELVAVRPNVPWPSGRGWTRFVGGVPSRLGMEPDLERLHEGEIVDKPVFSDGATWVRVHVPGVADDILVPVENLRP
jgi:hypothetical protein